MCIVGTVTELKKKQNKKQSVAIFFGPWSQRTVGKETGKSEYRWTVYVSLVRVSLAAATAAAIAGLELVVEQGVSVIRGSEMLELRLRRVGRAASIAPDHVVLDKEKNIKSMFIVHHDIKLIKSHNVAKNIKFGRHKIWILGYVKIF